MEGFARCFRHVRVCGRARDEKYTKMLPILPFLPELSKRCFMPIAYEGSPTGRVDDHPSDAGRIDPRRAAAAGLLWTFDAVQARMVEAVQLWWRMPGGGQSPYAADGPWDLIRAEWGDYYDPDARPRPLPLSRAEVGRMTEASEWMAWVPERDRRLVTLALAMLAKGAAQVAWMRLRRPLGVRLGADGLRKRYGRAISAIAARLNART